MDTQREGEGLETFREHWGLSITVSVLIFAVQAVSYILNLSGAAWIWHFVAASAMVVIGGSMIGCAKASAYRSGRLFTFGVASVRKDLRWLYRWGWRMFLLGVVFSLCLAFSRQ